MAEKTMKSKDIVKSGNNISLYNSLFYFLSVIIFSWAFSVTALAQVKGVEPPPRQPDSLTVFKSPRPLLTPDAEQRELKNGWGLTLILSNSGFGLGTFIQHKVAHELYAFASLYISGARKNDEIDSYFTLDGGYTYIQRVLAKKNRLFNLPLMVGMEKYFFTKELNDNFKPYAQIGLGPTFILKTPYQDIPYTSGVDFNTYINGRYYDFFESFKYAKCYVRWGGFIGLGANFESIANSILGLNLRYYILPFGGNGLESMANQPVTDFGGLFLAMNLGVRF